MRIDYKILLLVAFVGAIAGCSRQDEPQAAAAKTTVGTEIDDTVVTAKVKSALLADPAIKSFDLKIETRKGIVQISGFVDSQAQIDQAISISRKVEGVTAIGNDMSIKK